MQAVSFRERTVRNIKCKMFSDLVHIIKLYAEGFCFGISSIC